MELVPGADQAIVLVVEPPVVDDCELPLTE